MNRFERSARTTACAGLLAALLLPAPGQTPVSAAENDASIYQLELIIFRNYPISESERLLPLPPREMETEPAAATTTTEDSAAPADTGDANAGLYGPEASFGAKKPDGSPLLEVRDDAIALGDASEARWPLVSPEHFLLGDVLGNLGRAYGYRVLWHGSVILPMVKQRDYHFTLGSSTLDDERWSLQGQLQFRLSRFMHMNATLVLTDHTGPQGDTVYTTDDVNEALGAGGEIFGRYVLQQTRRMKSGQLHYIDHPAIGVLAMIQSVDDETGNYARPEAGESFEVEELDEEE